MKFKNYCVVFMGFLDGLGPEIEKISESKPNILDAKGIIIATFTSLVEVQEISAWFNMCKRSFLVFELNEENAAWQINKPDIQEGLFGFLKKLNEKELNTKTSDFLKTIAVDVKKIEPVEEVEIELTEADIASFSKKQKDELLNKYIDNGPENLTEKDKEIMLYLTK